MTANASPLKTYETICITKVDTPEDAYNTMVERVKSAIEKEGKGKCLHSDDWGKAKIAYRIGKDNRGRWTYFRYQATSAGVDEVQRGLRINESVLRTFTARADEEGADYNSLKDTMAQSLQDREHHRDWREERNARRSAYTRGNRYERDDRNDVGGGDDDVGSDFEDVSTEETN